MGLNDMEINFAGWVLGIKYTSLNIYIYFQRSLSYFLHQKDSIESFR